MKTNRPRKYFGQHFLHDRNILEKIIAAMAPEAGDHFVEIGPGRGALTRPLLERVAKLDVVEIDRDLARDLAENINHPGFTVHQADALKFDFSRLAVVPGGGLRLAGNLPYNISSPLLFHILGQAALFRDMHVMLQKEVVARMSAKPGSRTYGRLTVTLGARCRVEPLFDVKPGSFTPPPKVDSSFVRLVPDAARRAGIRDEKAFDALLIRAFSMRRKRVANGLKGMVSERDMNELGIDPDWRPEQINVDGFIRLANHYAKISAASGLKCP